METRLIIAYSLIAVLVLIAIASAFYLRYNTPDRRVARRRKRDRERMARRA